MQLVTTASMRTAYNLDDDPDLNAAVVAALDNASVVLEGKLRTKFALDAAITDVFFVAESFSSGTIGYRTRLLLSQGLLTGAVTSIEAASSRLALSNGEQVDLTSVDSENYTVTSQEKGVITVTDYDLSGMYVKVVYGAGLAVDGQDSNLYAAAGVPDWLAEVSRLVAIQRLAGSPFFTGSETPGFDTEGLSMAIAEVVALNGRNIPSVVRTLY